MTDAHFNSLEDFQTVGRKLTLLEARVNFAAVHQRDSQSVEEFASELRAAGGDCKFGATLDTRLRDQFVFGLVPGVIHDLLSEADYNITFSDAVKRASDLELEQFGSRPLLVPDWLAPQSTSDSSDSEWFSSDPLGPNNSATRHQLSEHLLTSHFSEPLHSGPHPSCYDSGPLHTESSTSSVALAPTPHSEPLLQLERCDASAPVGSIQSAPIVQIDDKTPDPDLANLQLISEEHLAKARTETSQAHLNSLTSDPAPINLQLIYNEQFAEGRYRDLFGLRSDFQNPRSSRPALYSTNVARPALLSSCIGHVRLRLPSCIGRSFDRSYALCFRGHVLGLEGRTSSTVAAIWDSARHSAFASIVGFGSKSSGSTAIIARNV